MQSTYHFSNISYFIPKGIYVQVSYKKVPSIFQSKFT